MDGVWAEIYCHFYFGGITFAQCCRRSQLVVPFCRVRLCPLPICPIQREFYRSGAKLGFSRAVEVHMSCLSRNGDPPLRHLSSCGFCFRLYHSGLLQTCEHNPLGTRKNAKNWNPLPLWHNNHQIMNTVVPSLNTSLATAKRWLQSWRCERYETMQQNLVTA